MNSADNTFKEVLACGYDVQALSSIIGNVEFAKFPNELKALAIDRLAVASALSPHVAAIQRLELQEKTMRFGKNPLSFHWLTVVLLFTSDRDLINSAEITDSLIWLVRNDPGCTALRQPYCMDILPHDLNRLIATWNDVLGSFAQPPSEVILNAAELFRVVDSELYNELSVQHKIVE